MNKKALKAQLAKAELQVVSAQSLVDRQRYLLTTPFSAGESIDEPVELLKQTVETQRLLIKHRDDLLKQLANVPPR